MRLANDRKGDLEASDWMRRGRVDGSWFARDWIRGIQELYGGGELTIAMKSYSEDVVMSDLATLSNLTDSQTVVGDSSCCRSPA